MVRSLDWGCTRCRLNSWIKQNFQHYIIGSTDLHIWLNTCITCFCPAAEQLLSFLAGCPSIQKLSIRHILTSPPISFSSIIQLPALKRLEIHGEAVHISHLLPYLDMPPLSILDLVCGGLGPCADSNLFLALVKTSSTYEIQSFYIELTCTKISFQCSPTTRTCISSPPISI